MKTQEILSMFLPIILMGQLKDSLTIDSRVPINERIHGLTTIISSEGKGLGTGFFYSALGSQIGDTTDTNLQYSCKKRA